MSKLDFFRITPGISQWCGMSTEMPVIQHPESIKNRGTGKSRVEDPKKNLDSKTHGRSILLMMVMGLEVFFFSPIGPRATFLGL